MDPTQLVQVESLCIAFYTSPDANLRSEAQRQILQLQTSSEFIPQCKFILEHSTQPYAQVVASTSLEQIVTQFWNNFSLTEKVELRNFVLSYLAMKPALEEFVMKSLTKLASRVTKLGWFDSPTIREILEEVKKFFGTPKHQIIGLHILNSLVDEMNVPTTGRTLTAHRKTAVSFRDQGLLQIFQVALSTLRSVQSGTLGPLASPDVSKITTLSLGLINASLSFDFIGTNPEDSAEDVSTVQVPSAWKSVIADPSTMTLLFDFYKATEPPKSNSALQSLVQISSVRRSLFAGDAERNLFLNTLMDGIREILSTGQGLRNEDNYHEFCRLLGRLKTCFQLSELVKVTGFVEWLQMACQFTVNSLANWQNSMNSIHYLLALWGRLVAALPYLRADTGDSQRPAQILRDCVLKVVDCYIKTMLGSVEVVLANDGMVDDPLDDESSLKEQMDRIPVIARLQYDSMAGYLTNLFKELLQGFEQQLLLGASANNKQIKLFEGRLTWMVYIVAAIIGAQTASDPKKTSDELISDGTLSACVFQTISLLERRMNGTQGRSKSDPKLEMAILFFIKSFKKTFLSDTLTSHSSILSIIPGGGSPVHPLLSQVLSQPGGLGRGEDSDGGGDIRSIFDVMGLGDQTNVMSLIVTKICTNIKYWHRNDQVLEDTVEVFSEIVTSYSSGRTLLGLEPVDFLVKNHTGQHFPFLGYDHDNKFRVNFYIALSRLVFSSSEDLMNLFDLFIVPKVEILRQLSAADISNPSARMALICVFRDLRGIATSTYNKRTYNLLFDVMFPEFFQLLLRTAETYANDPPVMTALFKFMQEFVYNKNARVSFDQSSANGILLFRETSAMICAYAERIFTVQVVSDIYKEKYKGIRLMLNILTCSLSGNYVNFGVFALYGDKCLANAMQHSLQVLTRISPDDIMNFPKLSRAVFSYLEVLYKNHLDVLCDLESGMFLALLKTNVEGLQSSDQQICGSCAASIDHVATYIFLNQTKNKPTFLRLAQHISTEPEVLNLLMSSLFNALLLNNQANHWAITRPILSLMLAAEPSYTTYQQQLIESQPAENHERLREEFVKLQSDIQLSLETTHRDRFTQKLTIFRLNVRQFLTF